MMDENKRKEKQEEEVIPTSFEALSGETGQVPSAKKPAPEKKQAASAKPAKPQQPVKDTTPAAGTSFSDLAGEEELIAPPAESLEDDAIPDKPIEEIDELEAINARVLTASGSKSKPYWLQALLLGIFSLLMFYFYRNGGLFFKNLLYWMALVPGGITVIWAIVGIYDEFEPRDRMLCGIGLVMGVIVVLGTLLF